jgi:hypothetical protein
MEHSVEDLWTDYIGRFAKAKLKEKKLTSRIAPPMKKKK